MKKILVNLGFSGFSIRENLFDDFMERTGGLNDIREDEKLIALVEQGENIGVSFEADIGLAEIPDNATDYEIIECDGKEDVLYVVDGIIRYAKTYLCGGEY